MLKKTAFIILIVCFILLMWFVLYKKYRNTSSTETPSPTLETVHTEKPIASPTENPYAVNTPTPTVGIDYPENYFIMGGESFDFGAVEPDVLYSCEGANGLEQLLDFGVAEYYTASVAYKDKRFVTSEGISIGSTKEEVLKAYEKYAVTGIIEGYQQEKPGGELDRFLQDINNIPKSEGGGFRWLVFLKNLAKKGYTVSADKLLYVDNVTEEGVEQFGGLGAWIFVFDDSDEVIMIIWTAPTTG